MGLLDKLIRPANAMEKMANYDWSNFDTNIAKNNALANQMNTTLDNTLTEDIDINSLRDPFQPLENQFMGPHDPSVYDRYGNIQMGLENPAKDPYETPQGLRALFQNFNPSSWTQGLGLDSLRNKAGQGWDFAQALPGMAMSAMTGIPGIGMLMGALGNSFEDRTLGTSNVVDEYGNVHSSADLNKMNALGGGYTDAARSSRRARARLNNVLARKAAGKKYGNLDELLEISRKQRELDNRGYKGTPGGNTGSGAFAKFDNTSKNYGPHTKGGGNQGGGYSGPGAGTGSRGPRSRDGGIIMDKNFYADGGLATLFTRRG